MALWFRIFSSFMPRAYKVVLIFIVCFRYGEENRIDLWNGQNTETAYKYMESYCLSWNPYVAFQKV